MFERISARESSLHTKELIFAYYKRKVLGRLFLRRRLQTHPGAI